MSKRSSAPATKPHKDKAQSLSQAKAQAKVSAQPKNLLQFLWSKILWFIHKRRELQKRYRKAIIWGNVALVALVLVGMVIGMHVFAPDTSKYETRSPVLFDTQGNVLYSAMTEGDYHRIHTTVHDVDPLYLKMLIAAEDERFYHHIGVDSFAIVRAMLSNVEAGTVVSGASTLTMQVCRLLEPKERSIFNKVKEALGALYLTFYVGREEVLNMYLTLAPFGGNIEGVTAASYMYFGHGPQHLTPDEAALLVALPRAPEGMRPDLHPQKAHYYRHAVLQKAYEDGLIAADVMKLADQEPLPHKRLPLPQTAYHLGQSLFTGKLQPPELDRIYPTISVTTDTNGQNLKRKRATELYSTIDPQVQQGLNRAASEYMEQLPTHLRDQGQESIALLAVDNRTFEVLGYVGSPHLSFSYVDAVQSLRSPGSALKPFAYAMAFEQGLLHPNSLLLDVARFYGSYQPRNYDRKFFGEMTAALALQASINLPALEVMQAIGPVNFINNLNQFSNAHDLSSHKGELKSYTHGRLHLAPNTEPHLGIILGAADITLYDLTQLYAALAHDGGIAPLTVLRPPHGRAAAASAASASADGSAAAASPASAIADGSASRSSNDVGDNVNDASNVNDIGGDRNGANGTLASATPSAAPATQLGPLLRADAARATYKVLEGTPAPRGFKPSDPISYKTGTSYKYRDAIVVGSRGGLTVGIWTGRLDGGLRTAQSAYETVAPVLFKLMDNLPPRPYTPEALEPSSLLNPMPPLALARVATSSLGKVHKRAANSNEASTIPTLGQLGDGTDGTDGADTQGNNINEALRLNFPQDGARLQVGLSGQIMLSFSGGQSPYYVLINDELQEHSTYFTPQHNGFYNITVIDSSGASVTHQVLIQGIAETSDSLETLTP